MGDVVNFRGARARRSDLEAYRDAVAEQMAGDDRRWTRDPSDDPQPPRAA